ncbi:MAG TPA: glycosyltransferase family 9 protein [Elusimicrobiota bacterium]|nr:glycosyltransferase family 9 protein [Elusimicrobiota bacterium]
MSDPGKAEKLGKRLLDGALSAVMPERRKIPAEALREVLAKPGAAAVFLFERSRMGDVLLQTPVLSNLKAAFPHLSLCAVARGYNAPALADHPDLESLLVFPDAGLGKPAELFRFWRAFRRRWDAAFVMSAGGASLTSALLARLSGARLVAGPGTKMFGKPYSRIFYNWESQPAPAHGSRAESNLRILEAMGVHVASRRLSAGFSQQGKKQALEFIAKLGGSGPVAALAPGGAAHLSTRIAPPELFAAAAKRLAQAGARLVAIQGPGEQEAVLRLKELAGFDFPSAVFDLDALKAFFSMVRLLVANDGGTMHLAAASGARVLALFSATDPETWVSEGVSPVDLRGRDSGTAEGKVLGLALKLLEPPAPPPTPS